MLPLSWNCPSQFFWLVLPAGRKNVFFLQASNISNSQNKWSTCPKDNALRVLCDPLHSCTLRCVLDFWCCLSVLKEIKQVTIMTLAGSCFSVACKITAFIFQSNQVKTFQRCGEIQFIDPFFLKQVDRLSPFGWTYTKSFCSLILYVITVCFPNTLEQDWWDVHMEESSWFCLEQLNTYGTFEHGLYLSFAQFWSYLFQYTVSKYCLERQRRYLTFIFRRYWSVFSRSKTFYPETLCNVLFVRRIGFVGVCQ